MWTRVFREEMEIRLRFVSAKIPTGNQTFVYQHYAQVMTPYPLKRFKMPTRAVRRKISLYYWLAHILKLACINNYDGFAFHRYG